MSDPYADVRANAYMDFILSRLKDRVCPRLHSIRSALTGRTRMGHCKCKRSSD